ncbi:50S ribosomal protein L34e [Candidatus Woesearchaeota archaeon]|nr:50S ribosomal protein L34e [Candidatus Woesearchaeota archaeon]
MPRPKHRSRSFRKVFRKVPGGRTVLHLQKQKPKMAHCAQCGAVLKGMLRKRASLLRNVSKTKKRVSRPYGGNLCSRCMRLKMVEKARV